MFVLAESFTDNTNKTRRCGSVLGVEEAHIVRSKGGILLPYHARYDVNTSHAFVKRNYDAEQFRGRGMNSTLPGPMLYVDEAANVHWAARLRVNNDARITIVPSTQNAGSGVVRLMPSNTAPVQLASTDTFVMGEFTIHPSGVRGFTAFDLYVSCPGGVELAWVAMTQTPME